MRHQRNRPDGRGWQGDAARRSFAKTRRAPAIFALTTWLSIPWAPLSTAYAEDDTAKPADAEAKVAQPANLYLARPGMSPEQLLDFIDRMKSKPKSLRSRPGFSLAILDAADRILASDADASLKTAGL